MGLDTSHDCFHGSYSTFNSWRLILTKLAGYGDIYEYLGYRGNKHFPKNDILTILLEHSDCDGQIKWEMCDTLSKRLKEILPKFEGEYMQEITKKFIKGLEKAYKRKENVDFH